MSCPSSSSSSRLTPTSAFSDSAMSTSATKRPAGRICSISVEVRSSIMRRPGYPAPSNVGSSVVAEDRVALLLAGGHGLLEVAGQQPHEQLSQALLVHVPGEARRVEPGPERPLRELDTRPAEGRDALAEVEAVIDEIVAGNHRGHQADGCGLVRREVPAGQHQLERS